MEAARTAAYQAAGARLEAANRALTARGKKAEEEPEDQAEEEEPEAEEEPEDQAEEEEPEAEEEPEDQAEEEEPEAEEEPEDQAEEEEPEADDLRVVGMVGQGQVFLDLVELGGEDARRRFLPGRLSLPSQAPCTAR